MADQAERKHNISDVWKTVTAVEKAQIATDTRLTNLESKFEAGFAQVTDAIKVIGARFDNRFDALSSEVHKPPAKTNWFGLITTVISVGGAMVAFVLLLNGNVKEHDTRQDNNLHVLREELKQYKEEQAEKRIADLNLIHANEVRRLEDLIETSKEVAWLRGRHEMLIQQTHDIDNVGSRLRLNDKGN